MIYSREEVDAALAKIGGTSDGAVMRAWLVDQLLTGIPTGLGDCALRETVGRLRVIREIASMLEPSEAYVVRDPSDPAVSIPSRAEPVGPAARGAKRRVGSDPFFA